MLIVNTSASSFKGGPTGVWLEEVAAPYYIFTEAGVEVDMANIEGGPSPIDAGSMGEGFFTDYCKKFMHDPKAFGMFSHQKKLADVMTAWNLGKPDGLMSYDAIYLAGGHGCCTDFVDNKTLKSAIEGMYKAGKIVAADCHGPIAFAQCVKPDGSPLVQGLTCTGFSDSEETAVQQTGNVPFLIETKFKEVRSAPLPLVGSCFLLPPCRLVLSAAPWLAHSEPAPSNRARAARCQVRERR